MRAALRAGRYKAAFDTYAEVAHDMTRSSPAGTIDNDDNPSDVPPWMNQRGFTFPVLLDDGYVARVGMRSFPTTWFLDREGRKVFEKVGWSEKLIEEFGWRVEAIRGSSDGRRSHSYGVAREPT